MCVSVYMCMCVYIYIYIFDDDFVLYKIEDERACERLARIVCGFTVIDICTFTCSGYKLCVVHLTNIQVWHTNSEECITSRRYVSA